MPKASQSPPPRHLLGPCWRTARPSPPPLPLTPKPQPNPPIRGGLLSPLALPTSQTSPTPNATATVAPRSALKALAPSRARNIPGCHPTEPLPRFESDSGSRMGIRRRGHEGSILTLEELDAKLATEAQGLRVKIQGLECSQQRYKARLQQKSEQVKDERAALEETRTRLIMAEEKVEEMEELVRVLSKELHQFRGWWLTEYLSLRALQELVPDKADVEALMSSAKARFQIYTATL